MGWFLESSGYCSAWAAQGQRKHRAENLPFSLNPPLPLRGLTTLITAVVKHVEGRSVPVRSCHLPMQSCHVDDPDLVFFLRATCRTSSGGDLDRVLPDHFLTRPHSGQTLRVPCLTRPNSFPRSTPESPRQGKRTSSISTAGRGWGREGMCRESGFFTPESDESPRSPRQCGAGLQEPDSCALIYFPPISWVLKFSVHFLKWQVSYPTLNKIKNILYVGEDK